MKNIVLAIYTFFNKKLLTYQFHAWLKSNTTQDLEDKLMKLGCTKTNTRNSVIFTTPNKKGKIVIDDKYVWINPK